jgi:hypothetical protein
VLANQDLDALAKNLQIGTTPVIISSSIEWLSLDDWQTERTALQKYRRWRKRLGKPRHREIPAPLLEALPVRQPSLEQWSAQKRQVNAGKQWIKVGTTNISMFRNPGKEDRWSSSPSTRTTAAATSATS